MRPDHHSKYTYGTRHHTHHTRRSISLCLFALRCLFQRMLSGSEPVFNTLRYLATQKSPGLDIQPFSKDVYDTAHRPGNRVSGGGTQAGPRRNLAMPLCNVIRLQRIPRPPLFLPHLSLGTRYFTNTGNRRDYRTLRPSEGVPLPWP